MSNKNKKFQPSAGYMLVIHQSIFACKEIASKLNVSAYQLAKVLEEAGFQIIPDPLDLSADTAKVILLQEKKRPSNIADSVSELDEEEMANE